jgi:hypothetical protein
MRQVSAGSASPKCAASQSPRITTASGEAAAPVAADRCAQPDVATELQSMLTPGIDPSSMTLATMPCDFGYAAICSATAIVAGKKLWT